MNRAMTDLRVAMGPLFFIPRKRIRCRGHARRAAMRDAVGNFPHRAPSAARLIQVKARPRRGRNTARMDRRIDIAPRPARDIDIDDGIVARALGIAADAFRRLVDEHRIAVRCERGTGEDEGLYRATFYHGPHVARLLVDRDGHILTPIAIDHG
jgi:hypothetical protein